MCPPVSAWMQSVFIDFWKNHHCFYYDLYCIIRINNINTISRLHLVNNCDYYYYSVSASVNIKL